MFFPRPDLGSFRDRAYKLLVNGEYKRALKILNRGARHWPDDWWIVAQTGAALAALGRHREAIPVLRRAVALDMTNGQARHNLGDALRLSGNVEDAIPEYEAALVSGYQNEAAHYGLAAAFLKTGDLKAGFDHYAAALRLNPTHAATLADLARIGAIVGIVQPKTIEDLRKVQEALERHEGRVFFG